jgi:hypothetical protein
MPIQEKSHKVKDNKYRHKKIIKNYKEKKNINSAGAEHSKVPAMLIKKIRKITKNDKSLQSIVKIHKNSQKIRKNQKKIRKTHIKSIHYTHGVHGSIS